MNLPFNTSYVICRHLLICQSQQEKSNRIKQSCSIEGSRIDAFWYFLSFSSVASLKWPLSTAAKKGWLAVWVGIGEYNHLSHDFLSERAPTKTALGMRQESGWYPLRVHTLCERLRPPGQEMHEHRARNGRPNPAPSGQHQLLAIKVAWAGLLRNMVWHGLAIGRPQT